MSAGACELWRAKPVSVLGRDTTGVAWSLGAKWALHIANALSLAALWHMLNSQVDMLCPAPTESM